MVIVCKRRHVSVQVAFIHANLDLVVGNIQWKIWLGSMCLSNCGCEGQHGR
jgi:hypothetical protein